MTVASQINSFKFSRSLFCDTKDEYKMTTTTSYCDTMIQNKVNKCLPYNNVLFYNQIVDCTENLLNEQHTKRNDKRIKLVNDKK